MKSIIIAADLLRDAVAKHNIQTTIVTQSRDAYGAVASLLTKTGNAYGCVFIDNDGIIGIHPAVEAQVRKLQWHLAIH